MRRYADRFVHPQSCDDGCCVRLDGGHTAAASGTVTGGRRAFGVARPNSAPPLLGINSDNDSAFINESVVAFCNEQKVVFTRSRPYRKNDQAWIEQKNGAVIRRFVGHARHSGAVAGQTLANLYGNLRLYVNFFQPSFKLLRKHREAGKVKKTYAKPATPCDRLLANPSVHDNVKNSLLKQRAGLDPIVLLHQIRLAQSALVLLTFPRSLSEYANLSQFIIKRKNCFLACD